RGPAGLAEVDALGHGVERAERSHPFRRSAEPLVLNSVRWVRRHTEHALCGRIMGRELGLPIGERNPRRIAKESVLRLEEHRGVNEASSPDTDTPHDGDVPEHVLREKSFEPEGGRPSERPWIRPGLFDRAVVEAPPLFEHGDAPPFFRQAKRLDTPAEAR